MANPLVPHGTLNRLLTSVSIVQFPFLNVTNGYFGTKIGRLSFEGDGSDYIPALTASVPSPRPYQVVTLLMYLLKSQTLSQLWENQRQQSTTIGDFVVTTDSPVLGPFYIMNGIFQNVSDIELDGSSNDYPVMLKGTYPINQSLFNF